MGKRSYKLREKLSNASSFQGLLSGCFQNNIIHWYGADNGGKPIRVIMNTAKVMTYIESTPQRYSRLHGVVKTLR
jgi:hypothetical protein